MTPGRAQNANDPQRGQEQASRLAGWREASRSITLPATESVAEGLAAELAAAAEEIQQGAGMERAGIMADYAARMRYAQRHFRKDEIAGALRKLKQQRQAALASLARRTATDLKGRLAAIRRRHRRQRPTGHSRD